MLVAGVDIGGSGIKAAIVDVRDGRLETERVRIATPTAGGAAALLESVAGLLTELGWQNGPVGIGFPGVIRAGQIGTAANLDKGLIGTDIAAGLAERGWPSVHVLNDADAAGYAEMRLGAGKDFAQEKALLLTVGTGIGSVLFMGGQLIPNLELGHLEYHGHVAEKFVSERTRKTEDLSWKRWGRRFNGFLAYLEKVMVPDCFILGGGGVKRPERFAEVLTVKTPIRYAAFGNRAGIIGAALAAAERSGRDSI